MPEQPKITIQGTDASGPSRASAMAGLRQLASQARATMAAGSAATARWTSGLQSLGRAGGAAAAAVAAPFRLLFGLVGALSGVFRALGAVVSGVFGVLRSLAGVASGILGALVRQVTALAGAFGGALYGALQRVFGFMATGAKVAALGLVAALGMLARQGVKVNLSLQSTEIGLQTILKSAAAAKGLMGQMRAYATESVSEFVDIAGWAKNLLAFRFGAGEVVSTIRTLGDAAAGLGGGADLIGRFILALGQMRAKGIVSGEEAMQMMEAGIPVRDYLGVPRGRDVAEMKIPAVEGIRRILAGMRRDFGGLQSVMAATLPGRLSNIKDQVNEISASVTEGLVGRMTQAAGVVLTFLTNLRQTREGQVILRGLSALFTAIGDAVLGLAGRLPQVAQGIAAAFSSGTVARWWDRIVVGVRGAIDWMGRFRAWLTTNWPAIWTFVGQMWDWFLGLVRGGLGWLQNTWAAVWGGATALLTTAARIMIATFAGVRAGLDALFTGDQIPKTLQGWAEALKGFAGTGVIALANIARGVVTLGAAIGMAAAAMALLDGKAGIAKAAAIGAVTAGLHDRAMRGIDEGQYRALRGINSWNTGNIPAQFRAALQGMARGENPAAVGMRAALNSWDRTAGMGVGGMFGLPRLPGLTPFPAAGPLPQFAGAPMAPSAPVAVAPQGPIYVPTSRVPAWERGDTRSFRERNTRGSDLGGDAVAEAAGYMRKAAEALERVPRELREQAGRELALAYGGSNWG